MTDRPTTPAPGTASFLPPVQPLLPLRPEQGRSLLTVLAVMAVLAGLALLFSRGADRVSDRWSAQLSRSSTVQVLIRSDRAREDQIARAVELLRQAAPDAEVVALSREASGDLLRPWLGEALGGALPEDLPIPGVIRIESDTRLPVDSLNRQFAAADLDTIIDDHSRFSEQLRRTVGRLVTLGGALLLLIGIGSAAVSIFATRSGLAAQRDIIHVLVQAGASDGFIARLFVEQAARRGALSAGVGALLAALVWLVVSLGPGRGSVGWNGIGDGLSDVVALLVLVGAFALVCAVAAGWAAHRQLEDERRRA